MKFQILFSGINKNIYNHQIDVCVVNTKHFWLKVKTVMIPLVVLSCNGLLIITAKSSLVVGPNVMAKITARLISRDLTIRR